MNITAGIYKGRKILAPDEHITRPTLSKTRMGVFNTLHSLIGEFTDKSFLDAFGGSGIMGLEALSRGFGNVTVFELNKKSAEIIKKNYAFLGITPDLYIGNSLKLITQTDFIYDVVYIDPPYKANFYNEIIFKARGKIIIIESCDNFLFNDYNVIKQKKYGNSYITYISKDITADF